MTLEEKINILLVDDSPSNLFALDAMLQAPDRNIVKVSSGDAALRHLLDQEAAVILLDVYMPGIDGLQTAELIRSREKSKDIPIIFLTADSGGHRHLSRGYSLGAVDYIVKPVEPEILRSKVAVFAELFRKTRQIKRQAELLHEKNLQLEDANLTRLNMLIELGQKLAAEHDPAQVLATFCQAAREIIGAEHAVVGMLNGDAPTQIFHCNSQSQGGSADDRPEISERVRNILLTNRRPLRLNESEDLLPDPALAGYDVQSFLGAPIVSSTRGRGWIYLVNKVGADGFSEADERLAETLATQVVVAYENASLYAESQRHASELQQEVAERKQAEEERARLLVREQAARAEAEQANRTKDEFLSTLSHELRTPLTAILGWSHLARKSPNDGAFINRAFETIERNARSQSQLVDDLLDVSRIITGKLTIDFALVDLSKVVASARESLRPSFEGKQIEFAIEADSDPRFVSGDANRLQQVFWNLFNNAIKFTPAGGRVAVGMETTDNQVRLWVTDTGIGIKPEFLPYIFDRFRQADGSTTRRHGGLGLGLAIVRHLVEIHQGVIEVESNGENQGSTFTVSLPLAPCDSTSKGCEPDETETPGGELSLNSEHLLRGLKILVVDDEADSLSLLRAILIRSGSEVRCCASAANAIREFKEWNPDLLVSDIGMPQVDGYELIRKLRELKSSSAQGFPAIALTAYATPDDRDRALAAGFQMHLAKPVEPVKLVTSVAAAVGRKY